MPELISPHNFLVCNISIAEHLSLSSVSVRFALKIKGTNVVTFNNQSYVFGTAQAPTQRDSKVCFHNEDEIIWGCYGVFPRITH